MTSMDDLITWLRAQLDDDERVAREAPGPEWVIGIERAGEPGRWRGAKADLVMLPPEGPFVMDLDVGAEVLRAERVNDGKFAGRWAVEHAARWDPARVLAEVEATRRILDEYQDWCADSGATGLEIAVKLLALPYADQPGYRDEWRP